MLMSGLSNAKDGGGRTALVEYTNDGRFLAAQPDLSPKAWPRFVRITGALPTPPRYDALIARIRTGAVGLTRPDR